MIQAIKLLVYFSQGVIIGFINSEIQQNLRLFQIVCQLFEFFDFICNGRALFQDGLGFFRIVPESIFSDMLLDFSEAIFFTCKVKDSSADLPVFV